MSTLQKPKIPQGLKALVHLGLLSSPEARIAEGDNYSMECPLCYGTKSFGVALIEGEKNGRAVSPGMWHCFRCGESGNTVSLLQKVYAIAAAQTSDLSLLAKDRGLPEALLEEYGIVKSLYTEQFWVPIFNETGTLNNIYRYDLTLKAEKSPYAFMGCPGQGVGLYNVHTLQDPPPGNALKGKALATERLSYPLRIVEGHWDTIALDHILREAGVRSKCDVVGVPGAMSFQNGWLKYLDKRPVELMFDYDPPKEVNGRIIQAGLDGTDRTIKMIQNSKEFSPSSLRILSWTNELN